jgi:hypothetical protein
MVGQAVDGVRSVVAAFQDGYTARDLDAVDAFMTLFDADANIELIGIGASQRGGTEWFEGHEAIREIIVSDWQNWGQVQIDVGGAKITVLDRVAWLSTTGTLEQTETFDQALPLYLDQMKMILEDGDSDADERLLEASHFGVRRLRERLKGQGHRWPFVLGAVLVHCEDAWRFHTIHWSMPVD